MQFAADSRRATSALGTAAGKASRTRRLKRLAPRTVNRSFEPGGRSRNPELIRTNAGKNEIRTATPTSVFSPYPSRRATTGMIATTGTVRIIMADGVIKPESSGEK